MNATVISHGQPTFQQLANENIAKAALREKKAFDKSHQMAQKISANLADPYGKKTGKSQEADRYMFKGLVEFFKMIWRWIVNFFSPQLPNEEKAETKDVTTNPDMKQSTQSSSASNSLSSSETPKPTQKESIQPSGPEIVRPSPGGHSNENVSATQKEESKSNFSGDEPKTKDKTTDRDDIDEKENAPPPFDPAVRTFDLFLKHMWIVSNRPDIRALSAKMKQGQHTSDEFLIKLAKETLAEISKSRLEIEAHIADDIIREARIIPNADFFERIQALVKALPTDISAEIFGDKSVVVAAKNSIGRHSEDIERYIDLRRLAHPDLLELINSNEREFLKVMKERKSAAKAKLDEERSNTSRRPKER